MSGSWISWNPRIDDPANPRPSSKLSSESSWMGMEKCCMRPGRSEKRRSTISVPDSLARARTSFGVVILASPLSPACDGQGYGRAAATAASRALTLRYVGASRPPAAVHERAGQGTHRDYIGVIRRHPAPGPALPPECTSFLNRATGHEPQRGGPWIWVSVIRLTAPAVCKRAKATSHSRDVELERIMAMPLTRDEQIVLRHLISG